MKFGIILFFHNLQEVHQIYTMAASTGLLEVRIKIFSSLYLSYFGSDFCQICIKISILINPLFNPL